MARYTFRQITRPTIANGPGLVRADVFEPDCIFRKIKVVYF
ncbi:MAG: hypothetical protein ACK500_05525 [Flavobacteriales bacterium]